MEPQGFLAVQGVVLKRTTTPEGDMRICLVVRKKGKIYVRAPGAARGKVRFGGGTEPLVWAEFYLYRSPRGIILQDMAEKDVLWRVRSAPERLRVACSWAAMMDRYLPAGIETNELLGQFYWHLTMLGSSENIPSLEWRFFWYWMKAWGVAPDFTRCVRCGQRVEKGYWTTEGFVCSPCKKRCPGHAKAIWVDPATLQALREATTLNRQDFFYWHHQCRALAVEWGLWSRFARTILESQ
ncbi:MAG: DNA repair protein RecO [Synergistales bacterium]|nr:DNA repair protein RecO [Synergistales bacterium]